MSVIQRQIGKSALPSDNVMPMIAFQTLRYSVMAWTYGQPTGHLVNSLSIRYIHSPFGKSVSTVVVCMCMAETRVVRIA